MNIWIPVLSLIAAGIVVLLVFFWFMREWRSLQEQSSAERLCWQSERESLQGRQEEIRSNYHRETEKLQQSYEQQLREERERRIGAEKDLENVRENLQNAERVKRELSQHFENLSNRIYQEKQGRFMEESRSAMQQLLNPVREELQGFRRRSEDLQAAAGRERAALETNLKHLLEANARLTDEAHNLSRALKSDSRVRGSWGEIVLERLLEESGLSEGREYRKQHSGSDSEGRRLRPDVVIQLPENRHVVIDSKVSLLDWERAISAEDTDAGERDQHFAAHANAVRRHVLELGSKRYQKMEHINGADLVLMFMPVEAAFLEALRRTPELYREAWEQRVAVVGPTTLLAVLKIIENLWQIDRSNRNAQEIARHGGAMYDKLAGFVETLDKLGHTLKRAVESFENAKGQLSEGRGNLLGRAEKMKALGLQTKKTLPGAEESSECAAPDDGDRTEKSSAHTVSPPVYQSGEHFEDVPGIGPEE